MAAAGPGEGGGRWAGRRLNSARRAIITMRREQKWVDDGKDDGRRVLSLWEECVRVFASSPTLPEPKGKAATAAPTRRRQAGRQLRPGPTFAASPPYVILVANTLNALTHTILIPDALTTTRRQHYHSADAAPYFAINFSPSFVCLPPTASLQGWQSFVTPHYFGASMETVCRYS